MFVEIAHILLQEMAADFESIPMPTAAAAHRGNLDFADMGWSMLELDIAPYMSKTEKVNVTLPGYVIQRIYRYVREHNVKSRSSFLADAAMEKLVRHCAVSVNWPSRASRIAREAVDRLGSRQRTLLRNT